MKKASYYVLGVMSGTSLDGIDIAACHFHITHTGWNYAIEKATTVPYPEPWKKRLQEAVHFQSEELQALNRDYTYFLGKEVLNFIQSNSISNLDVVCSHGHTILHEPKKGITLQIGNLQELAQYTQHKVVCNFRVQDVDLGGQGAPLVPIGDKLLFSSYDYCLNLGGFANVSFQEHESPIAYDICPVNIVLNFYAEKLGAPYDHHGEWAAEGTINKELLSELNSIAFYQENPPKSLGLEWVQQEIFPVLERSRLSEKDILCTFVEHASMQIGKQFKAHSKILVTGGGAYNDYLIEQLKFHTEGALILPEKKLIEYKEALVFGLLGVLRLRNELNCLSSVTGASKDHSSGEVFLC